MADKPGPSSKPGANEEFGPDDELSDAELHAIAGGRPDLGWLAMRDKGQDTGSQEASRPIPPFDLTDNIP